jgi:hypothetical protein
MFTQPSEIPMPSTELNMRVVTLEEAIADVSRNPRDFLIINRECHPRDIPRPNKLLLERLRENGAVDLLIGLATLAETNAYLPIGRDRENFSAGQFVLIKVTAVHETPERGVGGQDVLGLEKRARDGLYVTVAMMTEGLRACADFAERRKMATETRRGYIFERLDPLLPEDRSAQNCFAEGQKLIKTWYAGPTSYQTMKSAYAAVLELLRGGADPVLVETKQIELVRTASAIYTKAVAFLEAQHATSDMIRELMDSVEFKNATPAEQYDMQARLLREQAPAHHQEMAHNKQGGPSLPQLMRAAAAMDINPSWLFSNVLFYKCELDCAMQLGRAERGVSAILGPEHIKQLKRIMVQADEADGKTAVDAETEAAWRLRDLALGVKTRAGWEEFFAIAESDGREFCITKAQ